MGTKRVFKPKNKNKLTAKERMRVIQKKMKEFRKWYGQMNTDKKITLLILLWVLDKMILLTMFLLFD